LSESWRDFEALLRRHQSMVYSIALRITGERGSAEEVAQDVFLKLYGHLDGLESETHVVWWLRKVASRRAIDAARHSSRLPQTDLDAIDLPDETGNGDALLTRHLERLVAQLPEQMRAVIVLRYQEDLMPTEIAQILEMPVATVKSNLQRGLQLLRHETERTLGGHHG
jgi:RNA polymerase sigma-70 factor (ECF subfamily)